MLTQDNLGRTGPRSRRARRGWTVTAGAAVVGLLAYSLASHYWGAVFEAVVYTIVFPAVVRSSAEKRRSAARAALDANASRAGDP